MNDDYIQEDHSYRQQEELEQYEYWLFGQDYLIEQANKELKIEGNQNEFNRYSTPIRAPF